MYRVQILAYQRVHRYSLELLSAQLAYYLLALVVRGPVLIETAVVWSRQRKQLHQHTFPLQFLFRLAFYLVQLHIRQHNEQDLDQGLGTDGGWLIEKVGVDEEDGEERRAQDYDQLKHLWFVAGFAKFIGDRMVREEEEHEADEGDQVQDEERVVRHVERHVTVLDRLYDVLEGELIHEHCVDEGAGQKWDPVQ